MGAQLLPLDAPCRFSVHQVCQLLQDLGLQDTSSLQSNGISGGELLELSDEEIREDLGLSRLQASCNTPRKIPSYLRLHSRASAEDGSDGDAALLIAGSRLCIARDSNAGSPLSQAPCAQVSVR